MPDSPVLCYVEGAWAYFTLLPVREQWGDDWDDAPYEHNAGLPYDYTEKLAFDGTFIMPSTDYFNSPYSVQDINAGEISWLRTSDEPARRDALYAGATVEAFRAFVTRNGGRVYSLPTGTEP